MITTKRRGAAAGIVRPRQRRKSQAAAVSRLLGYGAALASAAAALSCAGFYYARPGAGPASSPARALEARAQACPRIERPLSAAEAAGLAVANSVDLNAEARALDIREAAWRAGARAYLPTLELSASSDGRTSARSADSFAITLSAGLAQPVWDGGRLATARALESAEIALARIELDRARRDSGEAAVSAYRSVVSARAKLGVRRASLESARVQRAALEAELALGLAKASDLAEADMSLSGMEIGLVEAEISVSISESELAVALGVSELPPLSERLDTMRGAIAIDREDFAAEAAVRSPDLELARYDLARKRAEAKAAAFAWLPSIGLKAGFQVGGPKLPLTESSWSLGLTVDFEGPFAAGGAGVSGGGEPPHDASARTQASLRALPDPAGYAKVRSAALAARLAEEKYGLAEAKAGRDAAAALVAYANAERRLRLARSSLELAEAGLGLAALRAGLGQALRSEVVEAEIRRAGEETALLDAASALIACERALERLLDLPPATLEPFWLRRGEAKPEAAAEGASGG